jgi:hypothetical protein
VGSENKPSTQVEGQGFRKASQLNFWKRGVKNQALEEKQNKDKRLNYFAETKLAENTPKNPGLAEIR